MAKGRAPTVRKVDAKLLADKFNEQLSEVPVYEFSYRKFLDSGPYSGIYDPSTDPTTEES